MSSSSLGRAPRFRFGGGPGSSLSLLASTIGLFSPVAHFARGGRTITLKSSSLDKSPPLAAARASLRARSTRFRDAAVVFGGPTLETAFFLGFAAGFALGFGLAFDVEAVVSATAPVLEDLTGIETFRLRAGGAGSSTLESSESDRSGMF